jgi:hypothetical protein
MRKLFHFRSEEHFACLRGLSRIVERRTFTGKLDAPERRGRASIKQGSANF